MKKRLRTSRRSKRKYYDEMYPRHLGRFSQNRKTWKSEPHYFDVSRWEGSHHGNS